MCDEPQNKDRPHAVVVLYSLSAALIKNEKYEDILVERINQITIHSEKLMKSMNISHMIGNRQGMGTLIRGMYYLAQLSGMAAQRKSGRIRSEGSTVTITDHAAWVIQRTAFISDPLRNKGRWRPSYTFVQSPQTPLSGFEEE